MVRVFDASAVLAALFDEAGADRAIELWSGSDSLLSSANYAEVVTKLSDRGMSPSQAKTVMEAVPLRLVPLDESTAFKAAFLREGTKSLGLSLGDRVCLALGLAMEAQVVTADRAWQQIRGIAKLDILLIR